MTPIVPPPIDWGALGPLVSVSLAGIVVLLIGLFVRSERTGVITCLALVGLAVAFFLAVAQWGSNRLALGGMVAADSFFVFFAVVVLAIGALAVLLSASYIPAEGLAYSEYTSLLLFATAGALLLASSTNLLVLLLGLELLSIALYVLAGFARGQLASEEAALKYFLLGAFSLGFLVYGSALLYGMTGSLSYVEIARGLARPGVLGNPLVLAGMALVLVGFAFKLAFVPFHMWTPDVYEGAPTSVTAFMAVGTKTATFAALLRVLFMALPALEADWTPILWGLAILTMVLGNVAAVVQRNLKRLLAYSSIAQAGYVLVGVLGAPGLASSSAMFYLLAYAFMALGAFAVLIALSIGPEERVDLSDYAGLAARNPYLAAAMALFMLSLAGLPPTAGFMAKLSVFAAAVAAGRTELALIGVLTSAIAVFYYLRVVVVMYMREAGTPEGFRVPASLSAGLLAAAAATLLLGVFPALSLDLAQRALAVGP